LFYIDLNKLLLKVNRKAMSGCPEMVAEIFGDENGRGGA
jgi:hypothetical protein